MDMRWGERGGGCHGAATSFALGRRLAIVATTDGGRDGEYTWWGQLKLGIKEEYAKDT